MAKKRASKAAGRPPKPVHEKLGTLVSVRFAAEHEALLESAVEVSGKKLAVFVRDAAITEARRLVAD